MNRSTLSIAILLMVSILLASCAAPNVKTEAPVMETTPPTEMIATETSAPTVTQEATAASTQILSATDDSSSMSEGSEVEIEDFAYAPVTITIKVGTTVTWTNKDSVRHTVTSDTGLFDSGLFGKGETFSYTFTEAGVFPYYCAPHPYMKGTVIVE